MVCSSLYSPLLPHQSYHVVHRWVLSFQLSLRAGVYIWVGITTIMCPECEILCASFCIVCFRLAYVHVHEAAFWP